ncbi:uncharacterized protein LOC119083841 [Bradysia coprophila]|uniref:uncharacterized protein LOC119083841 n=1 Tax=Bradysia coprophila TaxID=38358 RepID=UPI00187DA42A|nr:uncharacterized protein LOC119083841 [Bradysia coprophila]
MLPLKLVIALVIGVFQVCIANGTTREQDVTKLFSADELQRAKAAQISDVSLIDGKGYGLTIEEIIRLHPLKSVKSERTFKFLDKVCKILLPGHQTVTNYSLEHEIHLHVLADSQNLPQRELYTYVRNTICAYLSEPDLYETEANTFGSKLIPYMKIRYLKLKARNGTVPERIELAKRMCCVLNGGDLAIFSVESTVSCLSEPESNRFVQYWAQFKSADTFKSLQNLCDFVQAPPAYQCQTDDRKPNGI